MLSAALALACAGRGGDVTSKVLVDLRPHMTVHVPSTCFGTHTSGLHWHVPFAPGMHDLWALARRIRQTIVAETDGAVQLAWLAGHVAPLPCVLARRAERRPSGRDKTFFLSNVGRRHMRPQYDDVLFVSLRHFSRNTHFGPVISATATTFTHSGALSLAFSCIEDALPRDEARHVIHTFAGIVHAALDGQSHFPV